MILQSNSKQALGQQLTLKKHVNSMSSNLEPMILSCDTGQWIPGFDLGHFVSIDQSMNIQYQICML